MVLKKSKKCLELEEIYKFHANLLVYACCKASFMTVWENLIWFDMHGISQIIMIYLLSTYCIPCNESHGFRTSHSKYGTEKTVEAGRPLSDLFLPFTLGADHKLHLKVTVLIPWGKDHPYFWRHRDTGNLNKKALLQRLLPLDQIFFVQSYVSIIFHL